MLWRVIAVVLIGTVALACQPRAEDHSAGVRDDAGRVVRLNGPARRIVSLSPATTELLFDLGAGEYVVGRTRWCQDPPEALRVPSVGDGFEPNVEAIVARRPDRVVFYHSPANADAVERLEALGVATVSLRIDRLADFTRAARILGDLVDRRARADSLIAILEAGLSAASPAPPVSAASPTIAIIVWDNPPIVIGAASFLSELVTLAGARNLFGDIAQPSAPVSIETVAARDPDLLLISGGGPAPGFIRRPEWQVVDAVRRRRFVTVAGTEFGHPSFRAPEAVAELREAMGRWDGEGR